MKIKILAREADIEVVQDGGLRDNNLLGHCNVYRNHIEAIAGEDTFATILHEIAESYIYHSGFRDSMPLQKEAVCDVFSKIAETLMIENGQDIFERLKRSVEVDNAVQTDQKR